MYRVFKSKGGLFNFKTLFWKYYKRRQQQGMPGGQGVLMVEIVLPDESVK